MHFMPIITKTYVMVTMQETKKILPHYVVIIILSKNVHKGKTEYM